VRRQKDQAPFPFFLLFFFSGFALCTHTISVKGKEGIYRSNRVFFRNVLDIRKGEVDRMNSSPNQGRARQGRHNQLLDSFLVVFLILTPRYVLLADSFTYIYQSDYEVLHGGVSLQIYSICDI